MPDLSDATPTMANLSSIIVPFLLLNATNQIAAMYKTVVVMEFTKHCPTINTRLDEAMGQVEIRTDGSPDGPTPIKSGQKCSANFMTGYNDHGICLEPQNLYFKRQGVEVSLWTTKAGPDVVFNRDHYKNTTEWCTDQRLVTLEVSVPHGVSDQNSEFRFSFLVKNKSRSDIARIYNMDTYKECNLHYDLDPGKSMMIRGQRSPVVHKLPPRCWMTVSSTSKEESEQVCVTLTYSAQDTCNTTLNVTGFHDRWWDPVKSLKCGEGSPNKSVTTGEMCSKDKTLTFQLYRETFDDTGMTFTASVKSKRHPHWDMITSERNDLRGLGFMKGLTYFIATFDSLAGIIAALLATMLRHPRSFWKEWAESFSSGTKPDAIHYEVNYPAVSCSHEDEGCSEAKAY